MKNPASLPTTFDPGKKFPAFFILICIQFLSFCSKAQVFDSYPDFGLFTATDEALKQVDFDKDANSVIIYHLANTDYDDRYQMTTEHRVKIKVLNDKGVSSGDIKIRYYAKDGYEYVKGIEAVVESFEGNGQSKVTSIDPKTVYTVKINQYYSEARFAIPNVKAGSIFEYHYFVISQNYNLHRWDFQSSLPTLINYYHIAIIPKGEFTYKVYKLPEYPIEINNKDAGMISFKMANMPGLREEAFMDAAEDNLQHVSFQLSAFNNDGFSKQKYISTWDDVSRELLDQPEIGGQLNKSLKGSDEFVNSAKAITDPLSRVKAVYNFVQSKMSWNGFYSKYSLDGVKNAWEKGTGNVADLNLVFIDLLRQVDLIAVPLLVNDRDEGKIDIKYPSIDQFSKIISYVKLPDRNMVIDASDKETPMHIVPLNLLNTFGYKIDKKDFGLIAIEDDSHFYQNKIYINAELTTDGVLKGITNAQSFDYARQPRKLAFKKLEESKYLEEFFSQDYSDLKADSLVVQNLDKDSLPLNQSFRFSQTLNQSGGYTYFDYHMFDNLNKNPFVSSMRFSDINLGSPRKYLVSMMVVLPDNFIVDALPKSNSMRTADTSFSFTRSFQNNNGVLSIQMKFDINRSFFERDEYAMLQEFYKRLYGLLTEQIVLKKKT